MARCATRIGPQCAALAAGGRFAGGCWLKRTSAQGIRRLLSRHMRLPLLVGLVETAARKSHRHVGQRIRLAADELTFGREGALEPYLNRLEVLGDHGMLDGLSRREMPAG